MAQSLSLRRRIMPVLIGGFLGTISRYLLSQWLQGLLGKDWPYDILLINLTGAFVLAFVTVLADRSLVGPTRRLFINVGFLGAYTTFSSMVLGCVLLLETGKWMPGLLYLFFSFDGGGLSVWLGDWLGQQFCAFVRVKQRKITPLPPAWPPIVQTERANQRQVLEPLARGQLLLRYAKWATSEQKQTQEPFVRVPHTQTPNSIGMQETATLVHANPSSHRQFREPFVRVLHTQTPNSMAVQETEKVAQSIATAELRKSEPFIVTSMQRSRFCRGVQDFCEPL